MDDGWKTPIWSDATVEIPVRLLQEAMLALCPTRGLIQRLRSHGAACCALDARDERALKWGDEAYQHLRDVVESLPKPPSTP